MSLKFCSLRGANKARLPQFKNRLGGPAHEKPDGSDWTLADWMVAVTGEVGELASDLKSLRRGDFYELSAEEIKKKLSHEMADIITYIDILAMQLDIDLGKAIKDKFNAVSERVGSDVFIDNEGDWYYSHP